MGEAGAHRAAHDARGLPEGAGRILRRQRAPPAHRGRDRRRHRRRPPEAPQPDLAHRRADAPRRHAGLADRGAVHPGAAAARRVAGVPDVAGGHNRDVPALPARRDRHHDPRQDPVGRHGAAGVGAQGVRAADAAARALLRPRCPRGAHPRRPRHAVLEHRWAPRRADRRARRGLHRRRWAVGVAPPDARRRPAQRRLRPLAALHRLRPRRAADPRVDRGGHRVAAVHLRQRSGGAHRLPARCGARAARVRARDPQLLVRDAAHVRRRGGVRPRGRGRGVEGDTRQPHLPRGHRHLDAADAGRPRPVVRVARAAAEHVGAARERQGVALVLVRAVPRRAGRALRGGEPAVRHHARRRLEGPRSLQREREAPPCEGAQSLGGRAHPVGASREHRVQLGRAGDDALRDRLRVAGADPALRVPARVEVADGNRGGPRTEGARGIRGGGGHRWEIRALT
mmetsp:Transcript_25370/g.78323  ORF Transcript_25370/g.78323 Transcript_25370/m.78323 type:complete len:455 (-) Transcript_25370:214-1578(-)